MRTIKSQVTFGAPFSLNSSVGELPAGTYDIEVDEEEVEAGQQTAYVRTKTLMIIETAASTRTLTVDPKQLEAALHRDAHR